MKKDKFKVAYYTVFGDDYDFNYYDLLERVISRYEDTELDENNDDMLWDMVDEALIYYDDQWLIAKHLHNSPWETDYENDTLQLFSDLSLVIEEYRKLL